MCDSSRDGQTDQQLGRDGPQGAQVKDAVPALLPVTCTPFHPLIFPRGGCKARHRRRSARRNGEVGRATCDAECASNMR